MKSFVIFLSLVLASIYLSCGKAIVIPPQERSKFASLIADVLPPTWSLQERGNEVIVTRNEPVRLFTCVALDNRLPADEERFRQFVDRVSVTGNFRIRMRRAAKVEASEYMRLKSLNDQIVVNKSTVISNREFYEDGAMRSFDSRYHELPQYYEDSSSIYVETTAHPYECIYPQAVAEECDMVRQSLDSLFSRYSKDSSVRKLSYRLW